MIVEYRIILKTHTALLVTIVNNWIEDGWQPLGGVSVNSSGFVMQAMVKRDYSNITSHPSLLETMQTLFAETESPDLTLEPVCGDEKFCTLDDAIISDPLTFP